MTLKLVGIFLIKNIYVYNILSKVNVLSEILIPQNITLKKCIIHHLYLQITDLVMLHLSSSVQRSSGTEIIK